MSFPAQGLLDKLRNAVGVEPAGQPQNIGTHCKVATFLTLDSNTAFAQFGKKFFTVSCQLTAHVGPGDSSIGMRIASGDRHFSVCARKSQRRFVLRREAGAVPGLDGADPGKQRAKMSGRQSSR